MTVRGWERVRWARHRGQGQSQFRVPEQESPRASSRAAVSFPESGGPDVVLQVHRRYLEAGADCVETNSFGGTPLVLAEYGLADDARELNRLSASLARQAADEFEEDGRLRIVLGS